MKHEVPTTGRALDSVAVKDSELVIQACSLQYARAIGFSSPKAVIGKTDRQLFSKIIADEFQSLDQEVFDSAQATVNHHDPDNLGWPSKIFIRTPLLGDDGQVNGLDIQIIDTFQTHSPVFTTVRDVPRFRALFDHSAQAILVHKNNQPLYANHRWFELFGFTRDQLIGVSSIKDLLNESGYVIQSQECEWNGDFANIVFVSTEKTAPNSIKSVSNAAEASTAKVHSQPEDPSIARMKSTYLDYKRLLDTAPQGIIVAVQDNLVYANRAAANILQYSGSRDLLSVKLLQKIIRLSDLQKHDINGAFPVGSKQSQIAQRFELAGIQKDGRIVVLHAQAQQARWNSQQAVQIGFYDNTEQALTEQMLSESEQRFKHYAEAAGDFFWDTDENLKFTYVSEQLEDALGVSRSSLLGSTTQELAQKLAQIEDGDAWSVQLDRLLHRESFADFEFKCRHKDGRLRVIRYSGIAVFGDGGEFIGYRGSGREVTGAHQKAEKVAYHANHDSLTNLVNRRSFEESVKQAIASARDDARTHALCFLDLDNFKIVNDTCGHLAGDELLKQLSNLLQAQVRKSDVLARIGGDEFGVLLYSCGVNEALRLANQLRSEVESFQFLWGGNRFSVGASIGVVLVDERWQNTSSLFKAADSACYLAKDGGRNRVVVYQDTDVHANVRQGEAHWVEQIKSAMSDDRFKIASQSILPLAKDKQGVKQSEIFMRLIANSGAIINPKAFLPAAERYGLAIELDSLVVSKTLGWLESYPQLLDGRDFYSINLSGQSFANDQFIDSLLKQISESGVPGNKLCFELTETATIANLSSASEFMNKLGGLGCQFALDNFGSGLSSFAYLKALPVNYLKIDGLFVRDILDDPIDRAMVKAINEIGQTLGKRTVANFIENQSLLKAVQSLGVDYAQGYYIGQPEIIDA